MPIQIRRAAVHFMLKIRTYKDFINFLIDTSPYGNYSQAVIVTAIDNYTSYVVENEKRLLELAAFPEDEGFYQDFSMTDWIAAAKYIQKELRKFHISKP